MAGVTFTVEFSAEAVRAALESFVARMDKPTAFYQSVGEYMVGTAIKRNFDSETAPDGTAWAKLRPVTIKRREKAGQVPIAILSASRSLRNAIAAQPGPDGVRIGTPMEYAAVMQSGAAQGKFGERKGVNKLGRNYRFDLPWGDIPARPYLGLSAEDEEEIIRIAQDWISLT